jgi:hypothetical protein
MEQLGGIKKVKFKPLFSLLHIYLFVSKLQKRKPSLIHTRFLKQYFQVYKQAVGKFALN